LFLARRFRRAGAAAPSKFFEVQDGKAGSESGRSAAERGGLACCRLLKLPVPQHGIKQKSQNVIANH
jgi:hypothetical protein